MPASSRFSARTSGVAMSVDLQSDGVVLDRYRERLDGLESGERLRPAGGEVEEGAVAGALDRAAGGVELALGERPVVVRAAVLDRVQGAVAVEDADLGAVLLDQAHLAGRELGRRADGNLGSCGVGQEGGVLQSPRMRPSADRDLILLLRSDFSGVPGRASHRSDEFGPPLWSYLQNPTDERILRMSERTSYAPGTPCWVDLATPDLDAAENFYRELFGWEIPELPNSAEMGGYRRAKKGGRDVAGAMPLMQEGQPPAWSTYVSVD